MMRPGRMVTGGVLAALAGLHVAWGAGSSFPASDRTELADVVAGADEVPLARECFVVGALLATAALLVVDAGPWSRSIRRVGVIGASGVLAARGVAGVSGRTSMLVPWEPSQRFVALDRRYYGPLCLALAARSAASLRS